MTEGVFDQNAASYDAWYDTPKGAAIFAEEVATLRPLLYGLPRPWLEVGVGSGRFAEALGIEFGIDPARQPLLLARDRGIAVVRGVGERLPIRDGSIGAVLLVVALCFVRDPAAVLREARRVLRADGGVVLGMVFAESPWGQHYRQLAAAGHPYYRQAHFFSRAELAALLAEAGLVSVDTRSALRWGPTDAPSIAGVFNGDDPDAGFSAILTRPSPSQNNQQ